MVQEKDNCIIYLGQDPETHLPVYYENIECNWDILKSIAKILIPILISAGLKALFEYITSKDFELEYPGGKLKLGCNLNNDLDNNNFNFSKYLAGLTIENIKD